MADPFVDLVGVHGGLAYGSGADALAAAEVIVGARRQLAALDPSVRGTHRELDPDLDRALRDAADLAAAGSAVCMLASGDPGFFGLARRAGELLGRHRLRVHPAPSSVSLAFARLGLHWDDAVVVSAHGRPLGAALDAVRRAAKVAVLTGPDQPPAALGVALLAEGCPVREVAVYSRLGEPGESVWRGDLAGLAACDGDPVSVVVLVAPGPEQFGGAGVVWGRSEEAFAHRAGMVTKAEVRAVALGKLRLPPAGVLWDVGAGSGSVAAECAALAPGLEVWAVERWPDDAERIEVNTSGLGVRVVCGEAPAALAGLPDPDRVFVGGGGLDVLEVVMSRLRPGGTVVATYAALDRAAAAGRRLGHLVSVAVSRGVPVGADGALRLEAENPVFVCWGPERPRAEGTKSGTAGPGAT